MRMVMCMLLVYTGFINGSEFTDPCSPAPAAAVPPPTSASSTPPTAKADLPSVKKRQKRSKAGAKGDGSADGGMFDLVLLLLLKMYMIIVTLSRKRCGGTLRSHSVRTCIMSNR